MAERILIALRKPFTINGHENFISASVGLAHYPEDGEDADSLLRNADAAMYSVKAQGRNDVRAYRPELVLTDRRRWELELPHDLHKALERGELELHYQPQVDARTGLIPGVEALMRWNHGGRTIAPSDFIPIAEENGLIVPFGEWALNAAVLQAAAWLAQGLGPVRVSVNIPGTHFQKPGFVELVRRVLERAALPGQLLEIEITETMLVQDISTTLATLKGLQDLNVRMSIDDFGTGYSSLSYLQRFDIDQLKIDRSFVTDIHADSGNDTITAAIIAMAAALKLEVIAEGVETREQVQLLQRRGCQMMQGYYFSRPLTAAKTTALLIDMMKNGPPAEWRFFRHRQGADAGAGVAPGSRRLGQRRLLRQDRSLRQARAAASGEIAEQAHLADLAEGLLRYLQGGGLFSQLRGCRVVVEAGEVAQAGLLGGASRSADAGPGW